MRPDDAQPPPAVLLEEPLWDCQLAQLTAWSRASAGRVEQSQRGQQLEWQQELQRMRQLSRRMQQLDRQQAPAQIEQLEELQLVQHHMQHLAQHRTVARVVQPPQGAADAPVAPPAVVAAQPADIMPKRVRKKGLPANLG